MGDKHGSKWMDQLPFTLLGKRIMYQPDLDASSADLVLGEAIDFPGVFVGDPGPPLNKEQIHKLLHTLHQKAARPIKPMSRHRQEEYYMPESTQKATHVYVKLEKTSPLSPRYRGRYPIVSRPSKSTITVKEGTFISGLPKLATYNWETCKVAHMAEGQQFSFSHAPASTPSQLLA